jgi:hypothetical protein
MGWSVSIFGWWKEAKQRRRGAERMGWWTRSLDGERSGVFRSESRTKHLDKRSIQTQTRTARHTHQHSLLFLFFSFVAELEQHRQQRRKEGRNSKGREKEVFFKKRKGARGGKRGGHFLAAA